jgi:hypothetical protein
MAPTKRDPAGAIEPTMDFSRQPSPPGITADSLLPPGATDEPLPEPPPVISPPSVFTLPVVAASRRTEPTAAPTSLAAPTPTASPATHPPLTKAERHSQRLLRHAILFGFFVAVLIVICAILAR